MKRKRKGNLNKKIESKLYISNMLGLEPTVLQAISVIVKLKAHNWFGHINSLYIVVVI